MGGTAAVNGVPIVGQPVAYGTGFIALVVFGLSQFVAQYFHTFAHEGGHMLASLFTMRRIFGFRLDDNTEGVTLRERRPYTFLDLVITFTGYAAPPLLGVAGAALIAHRNPWAVLFILALFSALALLVARNGLAFLIPALVIAGVVWVALEGSASLQAAVAVGAVWFLLISGLVEAVRLPASGGDAASLASRTVLVPGFVWKLIWIVIAVVSLYAGGRLLLVPGA